MTARAADVAIAARPARSRPGRRSDAVGATAWGPIACEPVPAGESAAGTAASTGRPASRPWSNAPAVASGFPGWNEGTGWGEAASADNALALRPPGSPASSSRPGFAGNAVPAMAAEAAPGSGADCPTDHGCPVYAASAAAAVAAGGAAAAAGGTPVREAGRVAGRPGRSCRYPASG